MHGNEAIHSSSDPDTDTHSIHTTKPVRGGTYTNASSHTSTRDDSSRGCGDSALGKHVAACLADAKDGKGEGVGVGVGVSGLSWVGADRTRTRTRCARSKVGRGRRGE